MSQYFPRSNSHIPEEIFFSIISNLQPGAIWLLCRQVSKSWKGHVDSNIERHIRGDAAKLKSERTQAQQSGVKGCSAQRLQADSLYVKILWATEEEREPTYSSYLVLRLDSIDIPTDNGIRDLSKDTWDQKMTFKMEENIVVHGLSFQLAEVENFMYPGFRPVDDVKHSRWLDGRYGIDGRYGTSVKDFGVYQVRYTRQCLKE